MKRIDAAVAAKQLLLNYTCENCMYKIDTGCFACMTTGARPFPKEGTCEDFNEYHWPKYK